MDPRLPLPTLLARLLVAFTVEFDNEFEHRMPHRTSSTATGPSRRGPWLVSQVLWENVMRHIDPGGVTVRELHARARTTRDSLAGLQRWGYVTVDEGGRDGVSGSGRRPVGSDGDRWVLPTRGGRRAQEVWRPLAAMVEDRWRRRFGAVPVNRLNRGLAEMVRLIDADLPLYLPIVYPTQGGQTEVFTAAPPRAGAERAAAVEGLGLSALLAQVLLAFTIEFEGDSEISLAVGANTLQILDTAGKRRRDLPALSGLSKEAQSMTVGFLERLGCATVATDPHAVRGKIVLLTDKGERTRDRFGELLASTEHGWTARFGPDAMTHLRQSLEEVVGAGSPSGGTVLFEGLVPYPDGWRASVRATGRLPDHPVVLHRGGFPDGS